jgi:hypothetical protein
MRRDGAVCAIFALFASVQRVAMSPSGIAQASTPAPIWTDARPTSAPAISIASSAAFDGATGQLVAFGRETIQPCPSSVTWTWDGANWAAHQPAHSPQERAQPTMAYDPATKQVIMFGGTSYSPDCSSAGDELRDTWTWNGSIWTQQQPATSPTSDGCAAYDADTGQLIMFGGSPDFSSPGQTWDWTGSTWKQLAPATTPPGGLCSATYDETRKVIVMLVEDPNTYDIHTWIWNGSDWSDAGVLPAPVSPALGTVPPIGFDADLSADVVYIGEAYPCTYPDAPSHVTVCTQADETWLWNGSSWSQAPVRSSDPEPGSSYVMAYDRATHQMVMFGGWIYATTTPDTTTWVYSSTGSSAPTPTRVSGADRQSTAVAVSMSAFPAAGAASAVVLARADDFADALAGGPLAAAKHAPLLLTSSGSLDAVTGAEIQRVLPKGGTVYLLGGTAAISDAVATASTALGDVPKRISGSDRYSTAVAIAGAMGNPTTVFEASGVNFPDALSSVPVAVANHGAILLTDGAAPAAATAAYLAAHATTRYAIGGPAAYADPTAVGIAGADRYATSDAVALAFFPDTTGVSVASAVTFPDALSAGPVAGAANRPVVLVPPSGALPEPVTSYLTTHAVSITSVQAFGGSSAIADAVLTEIGTALKG